MKIPIVFAFDNNFATPASVAIFSLIKNCNNSTELDIYVLYRENSLDKQLQNQIEALSYEKSNCSISFKSISPESSKYFNNVKIQKPFSIESYFRLAIPEVFRQYPKVIYLDSDIVILKDITELYNTNLSNKLIAGVIEHKRYQHPKIKKYIKRRRLNIDTYINSGVLIFNNTEINKAGGITNIIEELHFDGSKFIDQDLINKYFEGNKCFINEEYNFIPDSLTYTNNTSELPEPSIIHYTINKPWLTLTYFNDIWWQYYRQLPFYNHEFYVNYNKRIYSNIGAHIKIGRLIQKLGIYKLIRWVKPI